MDENDKSVIDYLKEQNKKIDELNDRISSLDNGKKAKNNLSESDKLKFRGFLILSDKFYISNLDDTSFYKKKIIAIITISLCLMINFANTVFSTIFYTYYVTWSFLENLFFIVLLVNLWRFINLAKTNEMLDFKRKTVFSAVTIDPKVYIFNSGEKVSFKIFRIISYIGSFLSIAGIYTLNQIKWVRAIITLLEISLIVLTFLSALFLKKFYRSYSLILFSGIENKVKIKRYFDVNLMEWIKEEKQKD